MFIRAKKLKNKSSALIQLVENQRVGNIMVPKDLRPEPIFSEFLFV